MMFEYLLEPFLVRYYLLDAICGSFLTEEQRREMFYRLARIFCIPDGEALEAYYCESEKEHYKAIHDMAGYERLCRTIEFARRSGQDVDLTAMDHLILAQKRKAMNIKMELFGQGRSLTGETAVAELSARAMNGNIDAMDCLAYMEYYGILLCRDTENAVSRARLCARWNDLFGNLFCIAGDTADKREYYDTLYTVLRSGSQQQVFVHICDFTGYTAPCTKQPVARIMEKAFGMEVVKRSVFDRTFAKVAFSRILSVEDKQKLLLNRQRDAWSSLGDIPFDVTEHKTLRFDESCADALPLLRRGEVRKIAQNFAVAMSCPAEVCTPLLIVAQDEFLVQMYTRMLRLGLGDTPVVELDAGTLTQMDFAGSKENMLLRGLCETKSSNTVFLVKNCQELDGKLTDELVKMLDLSYRRKFKLFQPAVSLDLSGVRFVLLSGGKTAAVMKLAACCDTVFTERIKPEEKDAVINSVFRGRAEAYGRTQLRLEPDCLKYLTGFDTGQVALIVDGSIRCAIYERADTISLQALQAVCKDRNITPGRRGFGYTGGDYHA